MDRPEGCSDFIYELMMKCWEFNPDDRITFKGAVEYLIDYASEKFKENSFFHTQMPKEITDIHED